MTKSSTVDRVFLDNLPPDLKLPDDGDTFGWRVLSDYGAVFVARGGAVCPPVVVFADDKSVTAWQASVPTAGKNIGGIEITLQSPAMAALLEAREEARASGLDITPRGNDAARRSYNDTVTLWQSRVEPALKHWVDARRLRRQDAARITALSASEQIPHILQLESQGLYFSKDFTKSIWYSVAPPGTSQHLSMLALDVQQNQNSTVRSILAHHGWFQTVVSDAPHFTFLGVKEDQLPSLGLTKITSGGHTFWIPKLGE